MSTLPQSAPAVEPTPRPFDPFQYVAAQSRYYQLQGGWGTVVAEALEGLAREVRACSTPGVPLTVAEFLDRRAALERLYADR